MLDTLKIKPHEIAPKAAPAPSAPAKKDLEGSQEAREFRNELKSAEKAQKPAREEKSEKPSAKIATNAEKPEATQKVQAQEEAPVQDVEADAIGPKAFDPSMTKDVETAFGPALVENEAVASPKLTDRQVLDIAEGEVAPQVVEAELDAEIAQALLKTPQLPQTQVPGRAPAIEFAQAEVDPQLMNMEDFVAQKNLVTKKSLPTNVYGLNKPQNNAQKVALENDLKSTQVVKDIGLLENPNAQTQSSPMNSQQFILNMMKEQGPTQATEAATASKVFDMSSIKTSNASEIMNQITDYIVQAKAAKEPTVTMRINHNELGLIDITVAKAQAGMSPDAVAINIGTHSLDGKTFFQQNTKDLFSHLNATGVNVADLKIETPSQTAKNDFDMNHGSRDQASSGQKQFGSEQNQRRHDSERRQDLWKLFNKEAA